MPLLRHLSQPCGSSPICHDRMFEGGPPKPKGMSCHLVIAYCSLLIMETFGHELMEGFSGKSGLGMCSCPLDLFGMLPLDPSPVESLLLTFGLLGWYFMGNLDFGCMVLLPYLLILPSFLSLLLLSSFLPPSSTFLHWVHIELACPFPLPTPWVMA